jgi:myosin heavy subunit
MLETVKIRQAGFPVRMTFEEFFNKYYHFDYAFKEY